MISFLNKFIFFCTYLIIIFYCFHLSIAKDKDNSKLELSIYRLLKKNYFNLLPKNFIADIESSKLNEDLLKIPKEAYCFKDKKIKLKYIFIRDDNEFLVVENVENPFVNRFQMYVEVYQLDKMILGKSKSFSEFRDKVSWTFHSVDKKNYVVRMQRKQNKNYYNLIFIEKKTFLISKIHFYQGFQFLSSIDIKYKTMNSFIVPNSLKIYTKKKKKTVKIKLKNYQFNVKIKNLLLLPLRLQDDCLEINRLFS